MRNWIFLLLFFVPCATFAQDSLRIAMWNVENYFDTFDDTLTMDDDFTPKGESHWTQQRYREKRNVLSKTIAAMGAPDIMGLCEVENEKVVRELIEATALRKAKYGFVHFDSPDRRGIDCALLYRKERFQVLEAGAVSLSIPEKDYYTRDLLLVVGVTKAKDTLAMIVAHLPSKRGGGPASQQRERAMRKIETLRDSLLHHCREVVVMGDFNHQVAAGEGAGSYKYQGTWEWIDQIFVFERGGMTDWDACGKETRAFAAEWLLEEDPRWLGNKPFRCFLGGSYHGGVSDHLPIVRSLWLGGM